MWFSCLCIFHALPPLADFHSFQGSFQDLAHKHGISLGLPWGGGSRYTCTRGGKCFSAKQTLSKVKPFAVHLSFGTLAKGKLKLMKGQGEDGEAGWAGNQKCEGRWINESFVCLIPKLRSGVWGVEPPEQRRHAAFRGKPAAIPRNCPHRASAACRMATPSKGRGSLVVNCTSRGDGWWRDSVDLGTPAATPTHERGGRGQDRIGEGGNFLVPVWQPQLGSGHARNREPVHC